MKLEIPREVADADPAALDMVACQLHHMAAMFERLADAGRAERERQAETIANREAWFHAAARARDMVIAGHLPETAAKIAGDAFGQDRHALLVALDADGVRNGINVRFQRDFLIFQLHRAGLSNRQIARSLMDAVSEPTISRAIRRFQKKGPAG